MPRIYHETKTIAHQARPETEARARVVLQELLDNNPGYTPILTVKEPSGKVKVYTSLSSPKVAGLKERFAGLFRG